MTVVTLIGILAALAAASFTRSGADNAVNRWSDSIRAAALQARRRAVATRTPYLLDVRQSTVRWCQIDPATITSGPYQTSEAGCSNPPSGSTLEVGPLLRSPGDAQVIYYAAAADAVTNGVNYTAPAKLAIGAPSLFFFGPNGTASTTFNDVMANGLVPGGFTIYVEPAFNDDTSRHRRIAIFGISARPRIIENW